MKEETVKIRLVPVPWSYGLGEKLYIGIKVPQDLPLGEITTSLYKHLQMEAQTLEDLDLIDEGPSTKQAFDKELDKLWTCLEAKYKVDRLQISVAIKTRIYHNYLFQTGLLNLLER